MRSARPTHAKTRFAETPFSATRSPRALLAALAVLGLGGAVLCGSLSLPALAAPVAASAPEARTPAELRRAAKELSDAASEIVSASGPRPESTARAALANALQTAADTLKRSAEAMEEGEFNVRDATRRAREAGLRAGAAAQQAAGRASAAIAREGARIKSRSPEFTAALDKAQVWADQLYNARSPFWTDQAPGFATCVMLAKTAEEGGTKPVLLAATAIMQQAGGVASVTGPAGTSPARYGVLLAPKTTDEDLSATKRAVLGATSRHIVDVGAVGAVWITEETDPC